MGIFQKIHAVRVANPGPDHDELLRMLSEAISRGYVEQIPVMKPHPHAPNLSWYRDKKTGQIYSLDPPDQLPGWWTEVHPGDADFTDLWTAEEGTNGTVNQRKRDVKIFWEKWGQTGRTPFFSPDLGNAEPKILLPSEFTFHSLASLSP